jgi:hypothetical protein
VTLKTCDLFTFSYSTCLNSQIKHTILIDVFIIFVMLNVYVTCISARLTCHPEHEHLCYDGGISHCIPIGYKCDEDQDCNDGSDEGPKVCSHVSICLFV